MANAAWGIDIGNRALKAVRLQRTPEGVKITDFAAIEHDTILSEAGDNRDEMILTAITKFVGRHDTRRTPVAVSVTGQQSFARFVKLPPVEPKKRPEIVRFEAMQQIPFPLDDVEWSYQIFERDEDPDVEVGIFAMRKELVNGLVQRFVDSDLDVLAVQTSPLAVYNAVRADGRLDKGRAVILDLGAESTDMIIADNDSIWMRSLDVGGNAFTHALAKAFKISFEKAEELKRGAKANKFAKQIYQAMRPVFGEFVGDVQRSLGFYQSGHRDAEVRKVIALGGGFKLNGLSGYLQKNLQMPVEKPQRFNLPGPDDAGAAAALAENTLSGTAAYGLALQALGDAAVTSSLLPTHIRQDKLWRDKTKYFIAAGAIAIAAALVAFASLLFNQTALARGEADRAEIERIRTTASGLAGEWQQVAGEGGAELSTVRNIGSLRDGTEYWPGLMQDLLAALPGPESQIADALAGRLGDPFTFDDADRRALTAIPREQRRYVLLHSFESVYTDQLGAVVEDPGQFFTNARAKIGGTTRGQAAPSPAAGGFGGIAGANGDTAPAVAETSPRRGFIIRLRLITPVPVGVQNLAVDVFGDDGAISLQQRLYRVNPTPERPDLPYAVVLAGMSDAQPILRHPDVLAELRRRHEARQALTAPVENPEATRQDGFGRRGQGTQDRRTTRRPVTGSEAVDADDVALIDPVTGESMARDTVIEVLLAVRLDPPTYSEDESADEAGEQTEPTDFSDFSDFGG